MQAIAETVQHGGAASGDDRVVKGLTQVEVALLDRIDYHLVNAREFEAYAVRLEEDFGRQELLLVKLNLLTVWQIVSCLMIDCYSCSRGLPGK